MCGGFALIELLVAMAITGIVAGIGFAFFVSQNTQYESQMLRTELRERVRSGMDLIIRESRLAGYDPAGINFCGIVYNSQWIKIKADLNGDGDTLDENEVITYTYNAGQGTIYRNNGGTDQPAVEHVQSFTFGYCDATGAAVTSAAQQAAIRQIDLTITGKTSRPDKTCKTNGGFRTYALESKIIPRNLAF
jgi:prepilin-type N-terminal cleavage/methylation domain-containing protein